MERMNKKDCFHWNGREDIVCWVFGIVIISIVFFGWFHSSLA